MDAQLNKLNKIIEKYNKESKALLLERKFILDRIEKRKLIQNIRDDLNRLTSK